MFGRLRFLRFDAFGNLHCTKCYFWKDCCLPRITRRSKIACSSQFTLRYLDKNPHWVSAFRFPIQRFSIPQQYFCSHWLRNLFRVFACINTSKYVITRRSLPNQSMSLFVWCIPRLNSAGLLVRVCGSFRTLSLSMRLSGLVRKWTQKYKQKHSCIWSRYSFQQSHYFERFGRIQN